MATKVKAQPASPVVPSDTKKFLDAYEAYVLSEIASSDAQATACAKAHAWGLLAQALKKKLRHGKWLAFLAEHQINQRSVNRAMAISRLPLPEIEGLSLVQAENKARRLNQPRKGRKRKSWSIDYQDVAIAELELKLAEAHPDLAYHVPDVDGDPATQEVLTAKECRQTAAFVVSAGGKARAIAMIVSMPN